MPWPDSSNWQLILSASHTVQQRWIREMAPGRFEGVIQRMQRCTVWETQGQLPRARFEFRQGSPEPACNIADWRPFANAVEVFPLTLDEPE